MPLNEIGPLIGIFSLMLTIVLAIGGAFAFRGLANRSHSDIQKDTIEALQAQNAAQEKQIKMLERKVAQLERTIKTVQYTLRKRRRLRLEINGETITIVDERNGSEVTVPIHTGPLEAVNKEDA